MENLLEVEVVEQEVEMFNDVESASLRSNYSTCSCSPQPTPCPIRP
ncbi:hypothetical protein [Marinilactibacillus kalidii]|nr:hypothetical protein [Marinilactibacillus kalidii]